MVDFGADVSGIFSMGTRVSFASGLRNYGMAICRRLITPRGSLIYDLDYGFDLRAYINAPMTPSLQLAAQAGTEREAEKDPRTQQCSATISWSPNTGVMPVSLELITAAGPFTLVAVVSAVTVQLLSVGR